MPFAIQEYSDPENPGFIRKNTMYVLESHSRIPDYSGNMVSKFHNDWIKIQGELQSLKFCCKINIFGHSSNIIKII